MPWEPDFLMSLPFWECGFALGVCASLPAVRAGICLCLGSLSLPLPWEGWHSALPLPWELVNFASGSLCLCPLPWELPAVRACILPGTGSLIKFALGAVAGRPVAAGKAPGLKAFVYAAFNQLKGQDINPLCQKALAFSARLKSLVF